ncbi:hypothetical protein NLN86_13945 [Citrobacter portucalensis]|uniref:Uncharacterized protein n=1 Tax=Citrobacter portucalensis TaxID=1639133 RepID=A0AAW5WCI9_9ENTR|nr:hypothetical protein [Citrobacter portucalensis]MCX9002752.1 hypothetical protein [Citrobacter portucalensis]
MAPDDDEHLPTRIPLKVLKAYCKLYLLFEEKRQKDQFTAAVIAISSDLKKIENKYRNVPHIRELIQREVIRQQESNKRGVIAMSELDNKPQEIEQKITLHISNIQHTLDELKSSIQDNTPTSQSNMKVTNGSSISNSPFILLIIFTTYF